MASGGGGAGSPCGACKFLRRRCEKDCIFAPYFSSEEGAAQFAAIHRVFGASNVSKLLRHHVPPPERGEAVATVAYEAQARLGDPVYGCVAHIAALQSQVVSLQMQLMQAKAQLVAHHSKMNSETRRADHGNCDVWEGHSFAPHNRSYYPQQPLIPCGDQYSSDLLSPRSSSSFGTEHNLEEGSSDLSLMQDEMGSELHALAFRMMGKREI